MWQISYPPANGDRIKRSVLKNDFSMGGLNITDVECQNKALKLRQFLGAMESKHHIRMIQIYCLKTLGYSNSTTVQYEKIKLFSKWSVILL